MSFSLVLKYIEKASDKIEEPFNLPSLESFDIAVVNVYVSVCVRWIDHFSIGIGYYREYGQHWMLSAVQYERDNPFKWSIKQYRKEKTHHYWILCWNSKDITKQSVKIMCNVLWQSVLIEYFSFCITNCL